MEIARSRRLAIALALGAASAAFSGYSFRTATETPDFAYFWTAARVVAGGAYVLDAAPWVMTLLYLPALGVVLRSKHVHEGSHRS